MLEREKRKLRSLADRLGRDAQIETFESFLLQMNAAGEIGVQGCVSVLQCDEDTVVLLCERFVLSVSGKNLSLAYLAGRDAGVSGRVETIRVEWRRQG